MIDALYEPLTNVIEKITEWRRLRHDVKTQMRLFYLECQRNLALLDAVNLENGTKKKKIDTADQDYLDIAQCLETEILEMTFLTGEKNNRFFRKLCLEVNDLDDVEEEEESDKSSNKNETIITRAVYLYIRIHTLKKLARIPNSGKALKKIRFRTRLKNIRGTYIFLVNQLNKYEELAEIAIRMKNEK